VWTNIIDNAMAAMRDTVGTLTIRTSRERENMARIEICARTVSPRAARTWFPCATGQFDGDGSHVVGVFECDLQGARQAVWGMSQNCPRRLRRKSLLAKRNSQQSNTFAVTRRPSPHPWAPVRQWVTFLSDRRRWTARNADGFGVFDFGIRVLWAGEPGLTAAAGSVSSSSPASNVAGR
jgi:hypothetical protein